jgi:hypothetical protein
MPRGKQEAGVRYGQGKQQTDTEQQICGWMA